MCLTCRAELDLGPTAITFRRDPTAPNGERHVSLGSAWTVGGLAPPSFGVSNGRGGLIGSGTTAPLYTTSFSNAVSKAEEERENHEARLAKALELNRAQRILNCTSPASSAALIPGKRTYAEIQPRTLWNGTEWVLEGSPISADFRHLPSLLPDETSHVTDI